MDLVSEGKCADATASGQTQEQQGQHGRQHHKLARQSCSAEWCSNTPAWPSSHS